MTKDLTTGHPAKVIFVFSLPIILGNAFQQIYSFVDTVIVGRMVNYQALAGVGITNGMSFFVLGFVLGITSGIGIVISQFFGAGDMAGVRRSIGTGIRISAVLTLILTFFSVLLAGPMLRLIGTQPEIFSYARSYIVIIFAGIVSQVAYNLISCILRAMGDSRTPLYFLIFSSVLNVALDILFIGPFGWGVNGAAFATVLAQGLSAALCFLYAFRRYPEIRLSREDFRTTGRFVKFQLRFGLPMALQFSITAIGIILLQAALNGFPTTHIAGFTAANKVQNIGALVAISFGVAIANYAGQNYGCGNIERVRSGVRYTMLMSMSVCVVASLLMFFFADPLTSIFLDNSVAGSSEEIFYASRRYMYMSAIFFPFLYALFVYRNALQGIGKTFWPLMAGVLELIVRAVTSFVLPARMGYDGVTLVDVLAWVGACILLFISYRLQMPKSGTSIAHPCVDAGM